MKGLRAEERPRREQINALLVSVLQAQATLLRMSRVFPDLSASRRMSAVAALDHGLTVALARQLHRSWRALGVTVSTQKVILRDALLTVGKQTTTRRKELFLGVQSLVRKGIDPKAHQSLAAEGLGQLLPVSEPRSITPSVISALHRSRSCQTTLRTVSRLFHISLLSLMLGRCPLEIDVAQWVVLSCSPSFAIC